MNTIDLKGDAQVFKELIEGTISELTDDSITRVCYCAFSSCSQLEMVSLERVTSVSASAFFECTALSEVSLPLLSYLGAYAFQGCAIKHAEFPQLRSVYSGAFIYCNSLQTVSLASCSRLYAQAFLGCVNLTYAYFPAVSSINNSVFSRCSSLMSLYLLWSSVARLSNFNAFFYTPMSESSYTGSFGSIYVPASLVDSYKSAANWKVYSDRITAYTE